MFLKDAHPRGFTLLELLMVITVIGLLASILLVLLNQARLKGRDASIKTHLTEIRTQMEIYFSSNNHYGPGMALDDCPTLAGPTIFYTDITLRKLFAKVADQLTAGQTANCAALPAFPDNAGTWAVSAPLQAVTGYWCVDSTGVSGPRPGPITTSVCPP